MGGRGVAGSARWRARVVLLAPAVARADTPVTSLRPWAADNTYLAEDDLDGRAQPTVEPRTVVNHVRKGQWVKIECQTVGEEVYGSALWDKVNGLYVPDHYLKTYTTGFLDGAPRCDAAPPPPPDQDGDGFPAAAGLQRPRPGDPPRRDRDPRQRRRRELRRHPRRTCPPLMANVSSNWRVKGARVTADRLLITSGSANLTVEFRCTGKQCPFKRRTLTAAAGGRINVLNAIKRYRHRFRAGQTLEIRVTAPDKIGKVIRYPMRRAHSPVQKCSGLASHRVRNHPSAALVNGESPGGPGPSMGDTGFEPVTSRMSSVRSNQLS